MAHAGARLLMAGCVGDAIEQLRREARDAPTHAVHHNLAVALRARGEIGEALEHAALAEQMAPSCAATIALVGSLQHIAGDRAGAQTTFQRAVAIDPDHAVSRYYLAIATAALGERARAIDELRRLQAAAQLPAIVRERIHGQLSDLIGGDGPIALDGCSVPLVTELVDDRARSAVDAVEPRDRQAPRDVELGRSIDIAEARALLGKAKRIVALTGAGISSASGLATRKELWQRHDRDAAVSIAKFRQDPLPLWTVIREFLGAGDFEPNAAHRALAALPRLTAVITQNVDGLHQAASTPCPIVELHGTLLATRCETCHRTGASCAAMLERGALPPRCECGGTLRPDVVLFGEWVDRARLERAAELCTTCDVLLVVGTAADVAPAADLALLAASRGAIVVEVKRQPSRLVRAGRTLHVAGRAETVLPELVSAS